MRPLFVSYGVQVVAISAGTAVTNRYHREQLGLHFPLLADPNLEVIRQYGLLHRKGLRFFTFYLAGVPMGWPTGFEEMAIPTTLLVDEGGLVRWIDQAEDYRLRGSGQKIKNALAAVYMPGTTAQSDSRTIASSN